MATYYSGDFLSVQRLQSLSIGCFVQCSLLLLHHNEENEWRHLLISDCPFFHTFSQDLIFSVPHSYQASCTTLSAGDILTATVEMTAPACPPL